MKLKLFVCLMCFVSVVNAQRNDVYWEMVQENTLHNVKGKTLERIIVPDKYICVKFEIQALKKALLSAPLEHTAIDIKGNIDGKIIVLPNSKGEPVEFFIWQYVMMQPKLAEKYNEIKTFLGYAVNNPALKIRIGYSSSGVYASVKGDGNSWHIDPYSLENDDYCIVYRQNELNSSHDFQCHNHSHNAENPSDMPIIYSADRRDFRLAMAATAEYTNYFGGVANTMNEIAKLVNRLNQIYETDLNIRFLLVDDNDQIIYSDPDADPYTTEMPSLMVDQNIANLNTVIGSANYDVGHVVDYCRPESHYGGGLAYNNVVCTSAKGGGATSLDVPTGDPFYVSYVGHEIGHQFGASHTFNSTSSACGGGNRVGNSAYEPGSGSTVMSYAGICSPDNLQNDSDPYFHVHSILQINNYVATQSCYATIPLTNQSPAIVAMPLANKTIPKSTPFKLAGSAVDADNDSLTYCWEEYDLGGACALNTTQTEGSSPMFRSFIPANSPARYFPRLDSLALHRNTPQEQLPGYARSLKFMLTVRDGKGAVASDSISFMVDNNSGPFTVTTPNTAINIASESSLTVNWNVAGTQMGIVACNNVNILLSIDGGLTYPYLLRANVPNTGTAVITTPLLMRKSTKCRVMVEAADNLFFNISPVDFTIRATTTIPVYPEVVTDTALYLSVSSAALHGTLVLPGNDIVTETGFYYDNVPFNDSANNRIATLMPVQEGGFTVNIENLIQGEMYYYRAYAINSVGKSVGEMKRFIAGERVSIVDEVKKINEVDIYPNPSKNIITISTLNTKINKIEIRNMFGIACRYETFAPGSLVDINISDLSNGVYFCIIYTDKDIISKKIVKQ